MPAPGLLDDDVTAAARRVAREAAERAQVEVRPLHGVDVSIAREVIREAWGPQQIPQDNLLRALAHAGSTLLGATRAEQALGAVVGFLGWIDGLHLHSHMTAVVGGEQSRGVGYALKLWQRAECLDAGVREIRWTYDPLIARNAYFNLVKLGAEVIAFRPDFYGPMDDIVNAGDSSDRFEVSWALDSPRVIDALAGRPITFPSTAQRIAVPRDFDGFRREDPDAARSLRRAWREDFQRMFLPGTAVEWDDGGYVLTGARMGSTTEELMEGRRG